MDPVRRHRGIAGEAGEAPDYAGEEVATEGEAEEEGDEAAVAGLAAEAQDEGFENPDDEEGGPEVVAVGGGHREAHGVAREPEGTLAEGGEGERGAGRE